LDSLWDANPDGTVWCRVDGWASWSGTSATVSRALRLIDDGVLEPGGVVALASRLGVTDRWLRRLFAEQIGASPAEVARTRRAHFARRLLDETALPLEDIAVAAGYGRARRLHDAIQSTFRRPPSALRNGSGALVRVRDTDTPSTIERFEVVPPARDLRSRTCSRSSRRARYAASNRSAVTRTGGRSASIERSASSR
jgi:AraC-like DNA-binding protein